MRGLGSARRRHRAGCQGRLCCLCVKIDGLKHVLGKGTTVCVANRRTASSHWVDASFDCGFARSRCCTVLRSWDAWSGERTCLKGNAHLAGCRNQFTNKCRARCGTLLWIFIQQAVDHLSKGSRNRIRKRGNRLIDVGEGDIDLGLPGERTNPGRGLVGNDTQSVKVAQ